MICFEYKLEESRTVESNKIVNAYLDPLSKLSQIDQIMLLKNTKGNEI